MNAINIRNQRGLSMIGMIVICVAVIMVALLGIKVFPDVQEYSSILNAVKATAQDPSSKQATVTEIRQNFDKRKRIDNVTAIEGSDLDITKEGNEIVISFAYSKKIPLSGPVSLLIDFQGSSAQ